ncbi:sugar transporter [Cohnella abietis]|uniref:Sugar transporter n=1 Tax=Cohnella abietis TaxID=2507935 RepID=A0A3T1D029_9BACL|nr:MFS transporter [Cohnella abietis]BBI31365.1 sugar transporter [Cohnella abietis]
MLLKNRIFRIILASDIIQQSAIWIRNMALLFFIMEQTNGNPMAISLLTILEYAPIFVFSIIGGLLADRWNPKKTMIAGDLLSAASIAVIILLVESSWWQAVYGAVFVSAILSQFSQPSSAKMFKSHIPEEDVPSAIGITQSMSSLFIILGPILGTTIYQWAGLSASLIVLPVLFLISAAILSFLPKEVVVAEKTKSTFRADLSAGLQFVNSEKSLKKLFLIFSVIGLAAGLVQPLEIFIVTERLGLSKEHLQWFVAADGIGLLIGALITVVFTGLLSLRYLFPVAVFFLGVTFAVEALSVWPILTGVFRFANGILLAIVNTAVGSYIITKIPTEMVGRVNGIFTPISMAALLLGTSSAGVLAQMLGILPVYIMAAVICWIVIGPSFKLHFQKDTKNELTNGVNI